jgi:hypothetical protein
VLARGNVTVGGDFLDALAEPVIDVVEPAVLQVEGVASANAAVREEYPVRVGGKRLQRTAALRAITPRLVYRLV